MDGRHTDRDHHNYSDMHNTRSHLSQSLKRQKEDKALPGNTLSEDLKCALPLYVSEEYGISKHFDRTHHGQVVLLLRERVIRDL
jgi:hypothetical protein